MRKGMHPSEDARKKMRDSHLGQVPWNKGKKLSEISGKNHPMYGKHHSKESNQKNRESHLGKIPWNKNKHDVYSKKAIQSMKSSHIGQQSTKKNKTYEQIYGPEKAKELKNKLSERQSGEKHRLYGKHHTEETKQKLSKLTKDQWENKEIAKKMRAGLRPNGKELYLDFLLQNYFPDEWKYVGDGEVTLGRLCPDFINVNGKKKIIEHFGDHWHNRKNMKHHQTEDGRKKVFSQFGYSTLIIWEHELTDENKVIEKIRCFNESTN